MLGFGYALQYSVFLCDLDPVEKAQLKIQLGETMNQRVDSVAIVDLGEVSGRGMECFEFMGVSLGLPRPGARIL
jgi:CRISPR-associated protein Cas2